MNGNKLRVTSAWASTDHSLNGHWWEMVKSRVRLTSVCWNWYIIKYYISAYHVIQCQREHSNLTSTTLNYTLRTCDEIRFHFMRQKRSSPTLTFWYGPTRKRWWTYLSTRLVFPTLSFPSITTLASTRMALIVTEGEMAQDGAAAGQTGWGGWGGTNWVAQCAESWDTGNTADE